jgi:hypothetical protein
VFIEKILAAVFEGDDVSRLEESTSASVVFFVCIFAVALDVVVDLFEGVLDGRGGAPAEALDIIFDMGLVAAADVCLGLLFVVEAGVV